jgi:hypothetical protein
MSNRKEDNGYRKSKEKSNRSLRSEKSTDLEKKIFKIASLGAIVTGILACLSSVGVGLSLIMLGTMVFSEL